MALRLGMIGELITSTLFTLLALPAFYQLVFRGRGRWGRREPLPGL